MTFLGEFIPTNRGAIPERLERTVYGVVGDGVVLADRSIGFDAPVVRGSRHRNAVADLN